MAYVVLARKLRPSRFSDLIGQETTARILRNALVQDRVAHAFLFCGSRGTGKTSAARILTRALNCLTPEEGEPCGSCDICHEILGNASPDVFEIDAASNRGIENIRELRENVNYTPARCRYKVYIIDEAHMLTLESFNALLKTLEEPPGHVKFILATTDPHKVPQTIVSRCQRYDFLRIPVQKMADYLEQVVAQEGIQLPRKSLELIARHSVGGMRDALTAIDQVLSSAGSEASEEEVAQALGWMDSQGRLALLQALLRRQAPEAIQSFQDLLARGYDLHDLLAELLQAVKNISLVQSLGPTPGVFQDLSTEELEQYQNFASKVTGDVLQQMFQLLLELEERMKQSAYARICFEMTILQLASVQPLVGLPELIHELQGLGVGSRTSPSPPSPQPSSGMPPRVPGAFDSAQPPDTTTTSSSFAGPSARSITSVLKGEDPRVSKREAVPPAPSRSPEVPPPPSPSTTGSPVLQAHPAASQEPQAPPVSVQEPTPPPSPVALEEFQTEAVTSQEPPPEIWVRFVQAVSERSARLGGLLRNAIPDLLESGALRLSFRQDGMNSLISEEHLKQVEAEAESFTGRPISVSLESREGPWRTLSEQQQHLEQAERARKLHDGENLPLVQTLIQLFPGSRVEVRLV
ncbi:MAG: DNA polymerase III subunit gamma/tau [bacterium]